MNKRNLQIFGFSKVQKGGFILGLLVLILASFFMLSPKNDENTLLQPSLTGAVVQETQVGQQQQQTSSEIIEDTIEITTPETTSETETQETTDSQTEETPYYDYETDQCAADIKKAQDDIADIEHYVKIYQEELITFEQEKQDAINETESEMVAINEQMQVWQSQIDALQEQINSLNLQYTQKTTLKQEEITTAQQNLVNAQTKLTEAQNSCVSKV